MTTIVIPHLKDEYENQKTLFERQPAIVQRFLEGQAQVIAGALITKMAQVHFSLPDRIVAPLSQVAQTGTITIPETERQINVGGFLQRDVREAVLHQLNQLERSPDEAIAVSAGLLRYATAMHMLHNLLPAGRNVTYVPDGDEQIPTIPADDNTLESAITQASDAIVEEGQEARRGDLQTPFVPAARKFFLPQWVAFDKGGNLLVGSLKEAEAYLQSMQRYALILHRALTLAPYISADAEYQRRRYGILGQLINQGRALAKFKTARVIYEIKDRAGKQNLNRGLSLSLPYFDDQTLLLHQSNLEVIPAGRIMFIPGFVVRASRGEQAKVAQDTRLNASTRKHLLEQLKNLETAFESEHFTEKVLE